MMFSQLSTNNLIESSDLVVKTKLDECSANHSDVDSQTTTPKMDIDHQTTRPKTDVQFETIPSKTIVFSDSGKSLESRSIFVPEYSIAPELARQFLKCVVEGEQEKAEAMLKQNKALVLAANRITDLSGRTFEQITGFQYAVWALDRHMWSMIERYFDGDAAKIQLEGMENGSWVTVEGIGKSANWQLLLDELEKQSQLLKANRWDEAQVQWQTGVGGAQRQLPAHVVNTYCDPERSFERCPDFANEKDLSRTRKTDQGDWFTAVYNGGCLGEKFAVCRGHCWTVAIACVIAKWHSKHLLEDHAAFRSLLDTRIFERDALFKKYQAKNTLKK